MRRIFGWTLRGLAALLVGAAILLAAGAAFEAAASHGDARRYPAPGQLVDVGGHRLHMHCVGSGRPTVVIETGFADISLSWSNVQKHLASTTRVCAYDRAGYAWSERGPLPRTPEQLARELRTLLLHAGEPGPYVLVGHSTGGPRVRAFAAAYPSQVAGVALVDARHEAFDAYLGAEQMRSTVSMAESMYGAVGLARKVGVWRTFGPGFVRSTVGEVDEATLSAYVAMTMSDGHIEAAVDELRQHVASPAPAADLGALPLVVIAHGKALPDAEQEAAWQQAQREMARLSSAGRLVVAHGAGHALQVEAPELVAVEVARVVASARSGGVR